MKSDPLRRSVSLLLVCVSLLTWCVPSFALRQEPVTQAAPQILSGLEEQLKSGLEEKVLSILKDWQKHAKKSKSKPPVMLLSQGQNDRLSPFLKTLGRILKQPENQRIWRGLFRNRFFLVTSDSSLKELYPGQTFKTQEQALGRLKSRAPGRPIHLVNNWDESVPFVFEDGKNVVFSLGKAGDPDRSQNFTKVLSRFRSITAGIPLFSRSSGSRASNATRQANDLSQSLQSLSLRAADDKGPSSQPWAGIGSQDEVFRVVQNWAKTLHWPETFPKKSLIVRLGTETMAIKALARTLSFSHTPRAALTLTLKGKEKERVPILTIAGHMTKPVHLVRAVAKAIAKSGDYPIPTKDPGPDGRQGKVKESDRLRVEEHLRFQLTEALDAAFPGLKITEQVKAGVREGEGPGPRSRPAVASLNTGLEEASEERVLEGHTGPVQSLAFDPKRPERLVSGGKDGTIRGWNLHTGVKSLAHKNSNNVPDLEITTVAFSPDGQFFASAGNDGTIRLWNATTGRVLGDLKGHKEEVRSVAFGGRGELKLLASGSTDGTIRFWNYTKLEGWLTPLYEEPGSPPVNSVVFSPDGETLASAVGNDILIWDALLGERKLTLQGHMAPVTSLVFAADGKKLKLISGSRDRTIRFWNISEGRNSEKVLVAKPIGTSQEVTAIALRPDGALLAVGLSNGDVRLQDLAQGQELKTLRGAVGQIHSLAFSPDGGTLASAGEDKTIRLWDLSAPSIEGPKELSPRSGLEETEEKPKTPTVSQHAVWYPEAPRQLLQLIFRPENAGLALLLPAEGVQVRIVVASLEQRRALFRLRPDLAGAFVPGYEFDSVEEAVKFARRQLPEAQEVGEVLNRQDRVFLRRQVETWLGQFPWKVSSVDEPILDAILEGTQV